MTHRISGQAPEQFSCLIGVDDTKLAAAGIHAHNAHHAAHGCFAAILERA